MNIFTKTAAPREAEIARQLSEAEDLLGALDLERGAVALEAMTGNASAEARLAEINRKLAPAKEHVETLRAARRAIVARDEANLREQRAAQRRIQINALRQHLGARDTAAEKLAGLLVEAVKQWRVLLDRSAKAQSACPIGSVWPVGGTECGDLEIRRLVARELFRVSDDRDGGNGNPKAFPGAQSPSAQYLYQPEALPPMVDTIKAASAYVLNKLASEQ